MVKRSLGKGLDALIPPVSKLDDKSDDKIQMIQINQIKPNSFQPRRNFDEDKLKELADSIKEHGVVQPIVVRSKGDDKYEIIAGERRWRACKLLKYDTIPAIIKNMDDQYVTEIALIENIQREDLNPIEEAWAYKTLLEEFDLTQEELSKRVGKSRSLIANMMRLLNLPIEVQEYLSSGKLTVGHARALLAIEDIDDQIYIAQKVITQQLTVRETEKLIKNLLKSNKNNATSKKDDTKLSPDELVIEERLQEQLGTKVKLKPKNKNKGKIEIEYYSSEDLKRITDILIGTEEF